MTCSRQAREGKLGSGGRSYAVRRRVSVEFGLVRMRHRLEVEHNPLDRTRERVLSLVFFPLALLMACMVRDRSTTAVG
jgi:hypothetical protein